MRIVTGSDDAALAAARTAGAVVTIGAYDGVHLGHQAVLRLVRELADARGLEAALVTFDRHPAEVVRPESAPRLLTTLEQRLELLDATGDLDLCWVLTFDEARSKEAAEDFVREVLVDGVGARLVVVGADFHFGHRRGGNVPLLERMGAELGFEVLGLGLVAVEGEASGVPYSSTRIRELLAKGDVAEAARLLGRPHEVRGVVERGDQRGAEHLGMPTANLTVPERICLPADGVYAGTFVAEDEVERPAAISVGTRPTFYEDGDILVEAYVLDFDGDLYGQRVKVRFREWVRGQERFDSTEALVEQMNADVEATRRILGV
ncbi:MAG TPA: bifunctional riboflavin kinase/FAD synthetase [Acidimicrobiia bacterium]|jgi:riboflavin kinase/FMN adenylyltransferase|nr:bifunctional riboflavin kinase/FAD synthetase [Acidimicrobiia bacterium]